MGYSVRRPVYQSNCLLFVAWVIISAGCCSTLADYLRPNVIGHVRYLRIPSEGVRSCRQVWYLRLHSKRWEERKGDRKNSLSFRKDIESYLENNGQSDVLF